MNKAIRIACTFWLAVPLMALGWLLSFVWKPFGLLGLVGMQLIGLENVIA